MHNVVVCLYMMGMREWKMFLSLRYKIDQLYNPNMLKF